MCSRAADLIIYVNLFLFSFSQTQNIFEGLCQFLVCIKDTYSHSKSKIQGCVNVQMADTKTHIAHQICHQYMTHFAACNSLQ